jgi:hypothetical protein
MDSWQTVFVFRDRCVERVDTPALEMLLETYASETDKPADRAAVVQERPMELDRAQAKKERRKAKKKAYYEANADHLKEYQKRYQKKYYADAANIDHKRANNKQWRADAANIEKQKPKQKAYYQQNKNRLIQIAKETLRKRRGCVDCKYWPDWRKGWPHYDNMCFRCFSRKFPDHPKVRVKQRAEDTVKAYINANFAGFIHNHEMPTAHCVCDHRRRIDHRREVGNTLLCIETDEHHHRNYDKDDEDARYHDMLVAWGGKLVFIRINPDGKGPPLAERLERLNAEITRHIGRLERGENSAFLEVWHLYYPEGTEDYCGESIAPEGL